MLAVAGLSIGGGESVVLCDTLQPPRSVRVAATACHTGGARCLANLPGCVWVGVRVRVRVRVRVMTCVGLGLGLELGL